MKVGISACDVAGTVKAPPSKSYTHRALACALLANGKSRIRNPLRCDDTAATMRLCEKFGAEITGHGDLGVRGAEQLVAPAGVLDCGGSATTLRFFTAISAIASGSSVLTGNESLRKRPVGELLDALKQLGASASSKGGNGMPPIVVGGGGIRGGTARIRGDVSSQFISALLLACPRASHESVIELTTVPGSMPYVEMTMDVLSSFGVGISSTSGLRRFDVQGRQDFSPADYRVEGDFSSAAIMLAAGALAGQVNVSGLRFDSRQGDKKIVDILRDMGAAVKVGNDVVTVERGAIRATDIDASHIPDLVPVCAALATQARGVTRITNAGRLQLKESARLSSITTELRKMGAKIEESEDGLVIRGPARLSGADICSHDDHRIAMACAVAGLAASGKTVISGFECVNKSYPDFVRDMKALGAELS